MILKSPFEEVNLIKLFSIIFDFYRSIMKTDVLVIGSGIAGLTYALKVAMKRPDLNIIVLTKTNDDETNTKYAQEIGRAHV